MLNLLGFRTTELTRWAVALANVVWALGAPFSSGGDLVDNLLVFLCEIGHGIVASGGVDFVQATETRSCVGACLVSCPYFVGLDLLFCVLVWHVDYWKCRFVVCMNGEVAVNGACSSVEKEKHESDGSSGGCWSIPFCSSFGELRGAGRSCASCASFLYVPMCCLCG